MEIQQLYEIYSKMIQIRCVEEAIIREYPEQDIRTPVHLYIGQEAIAAGVSINLFKEDYIVSNHRSHGHCLAKGLCLEGFFKELYGKVGGVTNGKGGSMHLVDMNNGIVGTSAIVAGGIPIGAGTALKQMIENENNITVIYFGDGAVDEGIFWETINFASLKKLPILFVMEDNKYASQTEGNLRHGYESICKIINEFSIPFKEVDGNNALEIAEISKGLILDIRNKLGPRFLYCKTYRWMGHVGICDDSETGYRKKEEVEEWISKCPIRFMENKLKNEDPENYIYNINKIKTEWNNKIQAAIHLAKEAPYAMD